MPERTRRILFWGALAYFWSLINDDPLNADGILGSQGYLFTEVAMNVLSFICFLMAVREAHEGKSLGNLPRKSVVWMVLAFLWSSADDLPFAVGRLGALKTTYWYPFDAGIHAVSLLFLYLAVKE